MQTFFININIVKFRCFADCNNCNILMGRIVFCNNIRFQKLNIFKNIVIQNLLRTEAIQSIIIQNMYYSSKHYILDHYFFRTFYCWTFRTEYFQKDPIVEYYISDHYTIFQNIIINKIKFPEQYIFKNILFQNIRSIGCDAIKKVALQRERTVIFMVSHGKYSFIQNNKFVRNCSLTYLEIHQQH